MPFMSDDLNHLNSNILTLLKQLREDLFKDRGPEYTIGNKVITPYHQVH